MKTLITKEYVNMFTSFISSLGHLSAVLNRAFSTYHRGYAFKCPHSGPQRSDSNLSELPEHINVLLSNFPKMVQILYGFIIVALTSACSDVAFGPKESKTISSASGTSTGSSLPEPGPENPGQPEPPTNPQNRSYSEFFKQVGENSKVDLLIVVDNSPSMYQEQQKLGERIGHLLDELRDVDWQLGITTTDVSDGAYGLKGDLLPFSGGSERVLKPVTAGYEEKFLKTVVREETLTCERGLNCPSGDEQPLAATVLAMDKHATSGLFREEADFAVLILTDEDEMSTGRPQATKAKDVVSKFKYIWADRKKFSAYGIFVIPGDEDCSLEQGGSKVDRFATHANNLVEQTKGAKGSICNRDYSKILSKIGERARSLLTHVELKEKPIPSTLRVTFDPPQPHIKWKVNGKRVEFSPAPENNVGITVDYESKF